jgi:membrane protein YqaA with SNARE-associated domain
LRAENCSRTNSIRPDAIQQFCFDAARERLLRTLLQSARFRATNRNMNQIKLPHWLAKIVAVMGGGGLFVVAFLDSSVLSFPFITDALVIELSIQKTARMPYYCAMAAVGSLAGCIWLYLLAKKGGEAFFHRHAGKAAEKAKRWVERNAFLSVFIPGILPPPFPFKVFVLAEGVFQVPLRTFVLALLLGRALRYFVEGILAVRYGDAVLRFLTAHRIGFALSVLGVLLLLYVISRLLLHKAPATR